MLHGMNTAPRSPRPFSEPQPPALPAPEPIFHVRSAGGVWHVNDALGLVGGVFVSERAAVAFVQSEARGGRPVRIVVLRPDGSAQLERYGRETSAARALR